MRKVFIYMRYKIGDSWKGGGEPKQKNGSRSSISSNMAENQTCQKIFLNFLLKYIIDLARKYGIFRGEELGENGNSKM